METWLDIVRHLDIAGRPFVYSFNFKLVCHQRGSVSFFLIGQNEFLFTHKKILIPAFIRRKSFFNLFHKCFFRFTANRNTVRENIKSVVFYGVYTTNLDASIDVSTGLSSPLLLIYLNRSLYIQEHSFQQNFFSRVFLDPFSHIIMYADGCNSL